MPGSVMAVLEQVLWAIRILFSAGMLVEVRVPKAGQYGTISGYFDDPEKARPYFARLRDLRDTLLKEGLEPGLVRELSMGMSHDFEIAVQEGATIVRLGTAIFGNRHV